ncbi:hypothetical protein PAPYR_10708 [Paratrimastix pyriformis]|uniref:TRF2/HOY1 PH-like domain-containing protein n=1 Tax=Paratrimastix pyriformis TaxID=342808 RepID=A0ABQ8U761_9EUKA|nr:hypothetical protein PAPYR_10708 [Paratrimastix pyriformis]
MSGQKHPRDDPPTPPPQKHPRDESHAAPPAPSAPTSFALNELDVTFPMLKFQSGSFITVDPLLPLSDALLEGLNPNEIDRETSLDLHLNLLLCLPSVSFRFTHFNSGTCRRIEMFSQNILGASLFQSRDPSTYCLVIDFGACLFAHRQIRASGYQWEKCEDFTSQNISRWGRCAGWIRSTDAWAFARAFETCNVPLLTQPFVKGLHSDHVICPEHGLCHDYDRLPAEQRTPEAAQEVFLRHMREVHQAAADAPLGTFGDPPIFHPVPQMRNKAPCSPVMLGQLGAVFPPPPPAPAATFPNGLSSLTLQRASIPLRSMTIGTWQCLHTHLRTMAEIEEPDRRALAAAQNHIQRAGALDPTATATSLGLATFRSTVHPEHPLLNVPAHAQQREAAEQGMKNGVRGMKYGGMRAGYEVRGYEAGVWSLEFEMKCGMTQQKDTLAKLQDQLQGRRLLSDASHAPMELAQVVPLVTPVTGPTKQSTSGFSFKSHPAPEVAAPFGMQPSTHEERLALELCFAASPATPQAASPPAPLLPSYTNPGLLRTIEIPLDQLVHLDIQQPPTPAPPPAASGLPAMQCDDYVLVLDFAKPLPEVFTPPAGHPAVVGEGVPTQAQLMVGAYNGRSRRVVATLPRVFLPALLTLCQSHPVLHHAMHGVPFGQIPGGLPAPSFLCMGCTFHTPDAPAWQKHLEQSRDAQRQPINTRTCQGMAMWTAMRPHECPHVPVLTWITPPAAPSPSPEPLAVPAAPGPLVFDPPAPSLASPTNWMPAHPAIHPTILSPFVGEEVSIPMQRISIGAWDRSTPGFDMTLRMIPQKQLFVYRMRYMREQRHQVFFDQIEFPFEDVVFLRPERLPRERASELTIGLAKTPAFFHGIYGPTLRHERLVPQADPTKDQASLYCRHVIRFHGEAAFEPLIHSLERHSGCRQLLMQSLFVPGLDRPTPLPFRAYPIPPAIPPPPRCATFTDVRRTVTTTMSFAGPLVLAPPGPTSTRGAEAARPAEDPRAVSLARHEMPLSQAPGPSAPVAFLVPPILISLLQLHPDRPRPPRSTQPLPPPPGPFFRDVDPESLLPRTAYKLIKPPKRTIPDEEAAGDDDDDDDDDAPKAPPASGPAKPALTEASRRIRKTVTCQCRAEAVPGAATPPGVSPLMFGSVAVAVSPHSLPSSVVIAVNLGLPSSFLDVVFVVTRAGLPSSFSGLPSFVDRGQLEPAFVCCDRGQLGTVVVPTLVAVLMDGGRLHLPGHRFIRSDTPPFTHRTQCQCCRNPINLTSMEGLHDCAKGHLLAYVTQLRDGEMRTPVEIKCTDESKHQERTPVHVVARGEIITPHWMVKPCKTQAFWSFCEGKMLSPVFYWHCDICNQCRDGSYWHCPRCQKCTQEQDLPCQHCAHRNDLLQWRNRVATQPLSLEATQPPPPSPPAQSPQGPVECCIS